MKIEDKISIQLRQMLGPVPQMSKRRAIVFLSVLGGLFLIWLIGALYFYQQVQEDRLQLEQTRIEAQRRQEFLRRGAQYQQDLQQRKQPSNVRNVFDGR